MRILGRVSDLISVNVHALLDWAENPERMLDGVLRAMEESLAAARLTAAGAIAAERRLCRELDQNRMAAKRWQDQARFALAQGREDLARQALARKIDYDALRCGLEIQHGEAKQCSAQAKAALRMMKNRLDDAGHRQSLLQARQRAGEIRLELARFLRHDPTSTRFDQVERRLLEREDHLLAQLEVNPLDDELEATMGTLERNQRIEEELRTLKETLPSFGE